MGLEDSVKIDTDDVEEIKVSDTDDLEIIYEGENIILQGSCEATQYLLENQERLPARTRERIIKYIFESGQRHKLEANQTNDILVKVKEKVILDSPTQLYNKNHFKDQLRKEIDLSNRYNDLLSLIMADLDNFKDVNDTYGHQKGDDIILLFADAIRKTKRNTDDGFRFGGDEYSVLLRHTSAAAARSVAQRIQDEFSRLIEDYNRENNTGIITSASYGIAEYVPGMSLDDFVKSADDALYQSKRGGRNKITNF